MLTFNLKKYNLKDDGLMLDVGCGEGRHIFGVMQDHPLMKCIGIDMDKASLNKAEEGYEYFKSISNAGAEFFIGSAYSLPFESDSFDLIICSEVLEHLHEYNDAIKEIHRVLKPGGKLYILEFSQPDIFPFKQIYQFYFRYILPLLGKVVSNDNAAYNYLPESVNAFPYGKKLNKIIENCGYNKAQDHSLTLGIASIYIAEK